jgi:hypothetical protein
MEFSSMTKKYLFPIALSLLIASAPAAMAAGDAKEAKKSATAECKEEAKKAGLKDKKEMDAFVKKCKAEKKGAGKEANKK